MIRFFSKKTALSTKEFDICYDKELKLYRVDIIDANGLYHKQFTNVKEMFKFIRRTLYGTEDRRCRS